MKRAYAASQYAKPYERYCREQSIFEVVRHGMSREEAAEYIDLLSRYHRTGLFAVFGAARE